MEKKYVRSITARDRGGVTDISTRSRLRIAYLEREKKEIMCYIADLEVSLEINKNIIQDLCNTNQKQNKSKKTALLKLNKENTDLYQKLKLLKKEREEISAKSLILEQLLEEQKIKEREQVAELSEKVRELLEQLNLKEYYLQIMEKRCNTAEEIILKYLKDVPEAVSMIEKLNAPVAEGVGISNVVAENTKMKSKISELTAEVTRLKKEANTLDANKMILILKQNINGLVKENQDQKEKLESQTKMSQELYDLNEKLSEQLRNLNKQVSVLMHTTKMANIGTVYTQKSIDGSRDVYYTQNPGKHFNGNNEKILDFDLDSIDQEDDKENGNDNLS